MPKADPFAQRRLIDLAGLDRALAAAAYRRSNLPELAEIAAAQVRLAELDEAAVVARTEIGDLDRAARKLDQEIDAVRARAGRDSERVASGSAAAKELENLTHEIESLGRRQAVLEDSALELMERRETADADLSRVDGETADATGRSAAATDRRDTAFGEVDGQTTRLTGERVALVAALPADLISLYERIHRSGKVAAAELRGGRCEACRIDLDTFEVSALRTAPPDEVLRCSECGAILIRA